MAVKKLIMVLVLVLLAEQKNQSIVWKPFIHSVATAASPRFSVFD